MSEAAMILYGSQKKAIHDQIIEGRAGMATLMHDRGLDLRIAYTNDVPQSGNTLPRVVVADNPVYDHNGDLTSDTVFRAGSLTEASILYDRWSENYNQTAPNNHAPGIGVENTVNHYTVQNLGRDKVVMGEQVLEPLGIGIQTYNPEEAREFLAQNPGKKVFAKPNMGGLGEGARAIHSADALDSLTEDDILQEFCDTTGELPYLRPYAAADQEILDRVNRKGVEKELRMYTFYSTHADGTVRKDFWPILRTRPPLGGEIVRDSIVRTRIDPESVPVHYYELAEACGDKIMQLTGVRHLYLATDLSHAATESGLEKTLAIEINARHPGLWKDAEGARQMYADQAAVIAGMEPQGPRFTYKDS